MPDSKVETKNVILIFTDWYFPGHKAGGPIQSIYNLCRLLSKHFIVKIICSDKDLNSTEPYQNVMPNIWTTLEKDHLVMYLDKDGSSFSNIKRLIKENQGGIIYINGLFSLKYSFWPALLSSFYGVKNCFISVRGMLHQSALSVKPFKKQIFLAFARGFGLYKRCTLLATDNRESDEIKRSLGSINITIAPNIPMLPDAVQNYSKVFKNDGNMVRFLFLGRIAPEKNPLALIDAFTMVLEPCTITFCGSCNDLNYMNRFKEKLKLLPANIKWDYLDDIPHHEITELFSKIDVMVLPSLGENFGHAIFESFVHSVPVIIGNNTPWIDIESRMAGIEIEPTDCEALAHAIKRFILMETETYLQWSKSARDLSLEYFEKNNFEELYLKIFS